MYIFNVSNIVYDNAILFEITGVICHEIMTKKTTQTQCFKSCNIFRNEGDWIYLIYVTVLFAP